MQFVDIRFASTASNFTLLELQTLLREKMKFPWTYIAIAERKGDVRIFNILNNNTTRCILKGHKASVNTILQLVDRSKVATGSDDKTIKIWNIKTGVCLQTYTGHTGSVKQLVIIPGTGGDIASCGGDGDIIVWNVHKDQLLYKLGPSNYARGVIGLNANMIVSSHEQTTIKIWDTKTHQVWKEIDTGFAYRSYSIVALSKTSFCYIRTLNVMNDWGLFFIETKSNTIEEHLFMEVKNVGGLMPQSMYKLGNKILCGTMDTILIFDLIERTCKKLTAGEGLQLGKVWCIAHVIGNRIATSSDDYTVRVWNIETGECETIVPTEAIAWSMTTLQ
jgi:WD40 repeat protein